MSRRTWIVAHTLTTDVVGPTQVRVQVVGGAVAITARAEPGIGVEVSDVVGTPLELTATDEELHLGYAVVGWEGWLKRIPSHRSADAATVRLAVGPDVEVRAATVSAAVDVAGVAQDVHLASTSGRLSVAGTGGAVTARSVSGTVEVSGGTGRVRVSTVTGAVVIGGELPRVEVATVSGAVALSTTLPSSALRVQTVSGGVEVALPSGTGLELTARSVAGTIEVDGQVRRSGVGRPAVQVAERGEADAAFVDVTTVTGPVVVRRGDAVADSDTTDSDKTEIDDDGAAGSVTDLP